MPRKVTLQTKLKRGDIIRVGKKVVLGIVVRHEKFLGTPEFYAFNKSPDHRKFTREYGVDLYTRYHIKELIRYKAEIITRNELLSMHKKKPSSELKILLEMTKHCKRHR